jgi:hypothetical protein
MAILRHMTLPGLDEVREQDRERVEPHEIDKGDYVFYLPAKRWVLVDRVRQAAPDPRPPGKRPPNSGGGWTLERDTAGKWTFRFGISIVTGDTVAAGKVMRRNRNLH